jgi:sec-independent protein translocase protein TatC
MFAAPGLYEKEKKAATQFVIAAVLALLAGILFCYLGILPAIFPFLLSFGKDLILPLPTIRSSVSIIIRLFLIFGLIFEIPVASFYLAKIGLLKEKSLKGARKLIFLLSFVIAAIITPPDVISQLIVGFPLYGIFEISIILTKIGENIHSRKQRDTGK